MGIMNGEPLQPFVSPMTFFFHLPFSSGTLMTWVLYAVFIFWVIYTLIAIYHWLKYSHGSWIAYPAIAVHPFISFVLMAYALSGTLIV